MDPTLSVAALAMASVGLPAAVGRWRHRRRLTRLHTRVNVNGHRGKTTVSRLITGAFAADGTVVAGKTTGTVPRMLLEPAWQEWKIRRRPDSPNISEQLSATRFAELVGARTLVSECMAVSPDYQRVFADDLTEANIGVVCNVLRDHLDVMGPRVSDAAEVLAATVPRGGVCVTVDGQHLAALRAVARRRGAELVVVDPTEVDPACVQRFEYLVLPEHVAVVLAVAAAGGVGPDQAFAGMLEAVPDPYATRIVDVPTSGGPPARFVGGFSINDPDSTLRLWRTLEASGYACADATVILSSRADRRDRTEQMVEDVLPHIDAAEVLIIGSGGDAVHRAAQRGRLRAPQVTDLCGADDGQVRAAVDAAAAARPGSTIYGIGNVKGAAMTLTDALGAGAQTDPSGVWPDDHGSVRLAGEHRSAAVRSDLPLWGRR